MKIIIFLACMLLSQNSSASFFRKFKRSLSWKVPSEQNAIKTLGIAKKDKIENKVLNVLIRNVHKENFTQAWLDDFNNIRKNKDIILLQESVFYEGPIIPNVYKQYRTILGESFTRQGTKTGNATLSKYKIYEPKVIHSPDREPIIRTPKPIIISKFKLLNGKKLLTLNIHGINFVSYRKFKRMINKSLKSIKKHRGPVIYAGDFNTWSKRKTRFLVSSLRKLGLKWVKFRHEERVKTYFGYPLDQAFVRGLKILDADILLMNSSDHSPMVLKLELSD